MTHDPDEMGAVYARIYPANVVDLSARRREAARKARKVTGLINGLLLSIAFAKANGRLPTSDDYPEDAA